MVRATMSVEPPAGNGTRKRTGRLGHSCAEPAVGDAVTQATAAKAAPIMRQPDIEKLLIAFVLSCRREAPHRLAIFKTFIQTNRYPKIGGRTKLWRLDQIDRA